MANYFDLQNGPVLTTPSALTSPKITSIGYPGDDTAADTAGGQTITITGAGFESGATVLINTTAVGVVTVVSSTTITFTSPANSAGSYVLYVVNTDGGTAIAVPGIQYSGVPTWTTAAGSLGSYTETVAIANTVTATGDAPVTYSVFSGSLPTGATLNSANGYISGTSPLTASPTTYTFTIRATDGQQQDTNRTFSLTINPDVVTWSSPANGTTYTSFANSAISNVALSASAASGQGIVYTANALPTGLSISGSNITGTPTVAANSSTLLTATANTTNATATRTINWVISVANDTYFPYVTSLLSASTPASTFVTDASTNAFNVSVFGDTRPSNFGPYTPGYYSNYFDGTGDYLTAPNNAAFAFGTGDFTIECWLYYIVGGTADRFIVDSGNGNNFLLRYGGGTTLQFYANSNLKLTQAVALQNSWNHIAVVRSGTTYTMYINGSVVNTGTGSENISNSTVIGIGAINTGASDYFSGYISNLRIVKGTAVYTSTFTPSTTPLTAIANTSLLTCQSNRFIDNSTNNFTITRNGDTLISGFDPFVPSSSFAGYGSGYFDGTGDYLQVADNAAFNLAANNWTIEAWICPLALPSSNGIVNIASQYIVDGSRSFLFCIYNNAGTMQLLIQPVSGGTETPIFQNCTFNISEWVHVAAVRSGNNITLYRNGVSLGTTAYSSTINNATGPYLIGCRFNSSSAPELFFTGYISDHRLVNGTAVYTTNFTPPATPLTAIANTQLLTLQNNQPNNNSMFLDSSTNNFNITRNGNTTQGSFSPYGGGWSNYFGTAQFKLSTTGMTALGSDFTLELWIYPTSFNDYNTIFDNRTSDGDASGLVLGLTSAAKVYFYTNAAFQITTATSISLNTWTHIALVRSGAGSGNVKIYINGVADANTATYTTSFTRTAPSIGDDWGTRSNLQYYGYLSNLRATTSALYTSTFTPSTSPLTAISGTVLLTCQSNRFIDNSFSALTMTVTGTPTIQRFNPFNPVITTPTSYSAYFDGNGDTISASSNANLIFGTGDFTVECWINSGSQPGSFNTIIGGDTNGAMLLTITGSGTSTGITVNPYGAANVYNQSYTFTQGTWFHIAVTRSGTSLRVFVNGTQLGSTVTDSTNFSAATRIVGGAGTSLQNFAGYVSNARIVKGTAVYTSNFTPSTTPLTAISNTSLLTCQSATFIDNSTNNFTITATGDTAPRQFNPFGWTTTTGSSAAYTPALYGGSAYFDGTGDWLTAPDSTVFDVPGDYTVELWFYPAVSGGLQRLFMIGDYRSTFNGLDLYVNGSNQLVFYSNGASIITGGSVVNFQWNHVALVRRGSSTNNTTLYLNGISVGQATNTTSFTGVAANGVSIGLEYSGAATSVTSATYISDARLSNGTARYTSNFAPPVAPLTALQNTVLLNNMTGAGIYDSSMMNNYETVGNASINTALKKYGNTSMYFDGSGDVLSSAASQNFVFNGDFTVEGWVYIDSTMASSRPDNLKTFIFMGWNTGNTPQLYVYGNTTTAGIGLGYYDGTTSWEVAATVAKDQWVHIAYVRTGSTLYGFVAGTRYTINASISATIGSRNTLVIAGNPNQASAYYSYLKGYIDDFRITNGVARYTSNFTPPTTPFITN